ncbi:hypothetical protein Q8F55_000222 [Vanrija albida]|uniref:Major facilitator superfamily (MFS) profile domain-containing protein n=1 Tax=Vanrija albida TaxID=181172 RepID=A0ABR3QD97_9TREE
MEALRQYYAFSPLPPTDRPKSPIGVTFSDEGHTAASDDTHAEAPFQVEFESESDPALPANWRPAYRHWVAAQAVWAVLAAAVGAAGSVGAESGEGVPRALPTALFLLGLGVGFLPSAPLSQQLGRLVPYLAGLALAAAFHLVCALATARPLVLGMRFLAGLASALPLATAPMTLADVGTPIQRTLTAPLLAAALVAGLAAGPLIGDFAGETSEKDAYVALAAVAAGAALTTFCCMPETSAPALLRLKAARIRLAGDTRWAAPGGASPLALAVGTLRPLRMLAEPVLLIVSLALAVALATLLTLTEAYALAFAHFPHPALAYLPLMAGAALPLAAAYPHYRRYRRLAMCAGDGDVCLPVDEARIAPEERLYIAMGTGFLLPAGLFWLAWAGAGWPAAVSGLLTGAGFSGLLQAAVMYLMDSFGHFAASALSAALFVGATTAGLVLLAIPALYARVGTPWATSLFAFLTLAVVPLPFVLHAYGPALRARSLYTAAQGESAANRTVVQFAQ